MPRKKSLPDPEHGRGRGNTFWGAIVSFGEDLEKLQGGLGERKSTKRRREVRLLLYRERLCIEPGARHPTSG